MKYKTDGLLQIRMKHMFHQEKGGKRKEQITQLWVDVNISNIFSQF